MKKLLAIATSALLASSMAVAGGHAKSESAKGMAETIKSSGNGSEPAKSIKGGWGNAVGPATSTKGASSVGSKPKDSE